MKPDKSVCINFPKDDEHLFNFLKRFERKALRDGWTREEIDSVFDMAFCYSYHHILHTVTRYVDYNQLPSN